MGINVSRASADNLLSARSALALSEIIRADFASRPASQGEPRGSSQAQSERGRISLRDPAVQSRQR